MNDFNIYFVQYVLFIKSHFVVILYTGVRGVGTGRGVGGGHRGHMPPPNFIEGLKVPFFVMKSALFVQTNVAVNTNLTSRVPFLFGNFNVFKKIWSKTCNFGIV
jgi:hypothetical protein